MLLVVNMSKAANDNEPFAMISIGLAAELILNKLRVKAQLENEERYASDERSSTDSNETERDDLHRETKKPANRIGNRS
jgi:hypothetical protein